MTFEPSSLRIGVVDQAAAGWVAAAVYSRTILSSLDRACDSAGVELFFLSGANEERQTRSEEHTSELQSRLHLVCRLLLANNIRQPHATSAIACLLPYFFALLRLYTL